MLSLNEAIYISKQFDHNQYAYECAPLKVVVHARGGGEGEVDRSRKEIFMKRKGVDPSEKLICSNIIGQRVLEGGH